MRRNYAPILAALMICLPIGGGAHVALGTYLGDLATVKPAFHWALGSMEILLMCCCLVMLCLIAPRSRRERVRSSIK